jgi:hypothetical protein
LADCLLDAGAVAVVEIGAQLDEVAQQCQLIVAVSLEQRSPFDHQGLVELLHEGLPAGGQLDEHLAPIGRVPDAFHEPLLLEAIQQRGGGGRGERNGLGELACGLRPVGQRVEAT